MIQHLKKLKIRILTSYSNFMAFTGVIRPTKIEV
ncbi:MAG: hypothetical protein ACI95T_000814, partial [Flavobacteriales bacterium]